MHPSSFTPNMHHMPILSVSSTLPLVKRLKELKTKNSHKKRRNRRTWKLTDHRRSTAAAIISLPKHYSPFPPSLSTHVLSHAFREKNTVRSQSRKSYNRRVKGIKWKGINKRHIQLKISLCETPTFVNTSCTSDSETTTPVSEHFALLRSSEHRPSMSNSPLTNLGWLLIRSLIPSSSLSSKS
jgi:hypothetical protein